MADDFNRACQNESSEECDRTVSDADTCTESSNESNIKRLDVCTSASYRQWMAQLLSLSCFAEPETYLYERWSN
jgi:hypothetical protein